MNRVNHVNHELIERMATELQPVRPIKARDGWFAVALSALITVLGVHAVSGLWAGIAAGEASAFFMITNGLLLVLGLADTANVVAMVSPRVGNRYEGAKWLLAMAGVLPFAALVSLAGYAGPLAVLADPSGVVCAAAALLSAVLTGAALVLWLRRGAPVSLGAAGWQTGVAAGALGSVAHGLSCPIDDIVHLGIYHFVPVAIAGVIGAAIVPKLVRW